MASIPVQCPTCGVEGDVDQAHLGKTLKCRCGLRFTVAADGVGQFEAACPSCGAKGMVPRALSGKSVKCRCGTSFAVGPSKAPAETSAAGGSVPASAGGMPAVGSLPSPAAGGSGHAGPGLSIFSSAEVRSAGAASEIETDVAIPIFDLVHQVLMGDPQYCEGLVDPRAWSIGRWDQATLPWFPALPAIGGQAAVSLENVNLFGSIHGHGRYLLVKVSAAGLAGILAPSAYLLWDAVARRWTGKLTPSEKWFRERLILGPQHLGFLAETKQAEIVPLPRPGGEADFTARPRASLSGNIVDLAFSPDGRQVAVKHSHFGDQGPGNAIRIALHNLPDGAPAGEMTVPLPSHPAPGAGKLWWTTEPCFAPDGRLLGLTYVDPSGQGGDPSRHLVLLYDVTNRRPLGEPLLSETPVFQRGMLPERGLVAWVREPAVLEVWQLPERRLVVSDELANVPKSLVFSPDGRWLAVADPEAGKLRIYPFAAADMPTPPAAAPPAGGGSAAAQSLLGKVEGAAVVALLTKLDTANDSEFLQVQEMVLNSARKLERDAGQGADIQFLGLALMEFCDAIERYPDRPTNRPVLQQIRDLAMQALPEEPDPAVVEEFRRAVDQHVRKTPAAGGEQAMTEPPGAEQTVSETVGQLNAKLPALWQSLAYRKAEPCKRCGLILPRPQEGAGPEAGRSILLAVQAEQGRSSPALAEAIRLLAGYFGDKGPESSPGEHPLLGTVRVAGYFVMEDCPRCGSPICKRCAKEPHQEGGCVLCSPSG